MVPCWEKELNDILLTFAYKGFWFHVGKRNSMISYSRLPIKGFGFINLEFIHQAKEGLKPIATHSLSDVVHLLLLISPALPGFDRSASRISPYINHFDCFVQNTILLPITFFMSLKKNDIIGPCKPSFKGNLQGMFM